MNNKQSVVNDSDCVALTTGCIAAAFSPDISLGDMPSPYLNTVIIKDWRLDFSVQFGVWKEIPSETLQMILGIISVLFTNNSHSHYSYIPTFLFKFCLIISTASQNEMKVSFPGKSEICSS